MIKIIFVYCEDMESEVSDLMKQLRKAQSALKKALDRKSQELKQKINDVATNRSQPLVVTDTTDDEVEQFVMEIHEEELNQYTPLQDK